MTDLEAQEPIGTALTGDALAFAWPGSSGTLAQIDAEAIIRREPSPWLCSSDTRTTNFERQRVGSASHCEFIGLRESAARIWCADHMRKTTQ